MLSHSCNSSNVFKCDYKRRHKHAMNPKAALVNILLWNMRGTWRYWKLFKIAVMAFTSGYIIPHHTAVDYFPITALLVMCNCSVVQSRYNLYLCNSKERCYSITDYYMLKSVFHPLLHSFLVFLGKYFFLNSEQK